MFWMEQILDYYLKVLFYYTNALSIAYRRIIISNPDI